MAEGEQVLASAAAQSLEFAADTKTNRYEKKMLSSSNSLPFLGL